MSRGIVFFLVLTSVCCGRDKDDQIQRNESSHAEAEDSFMNVDFSGDVNGSFIVKGEPVFGKNNGVGCSHYVSETWNMLSISARSNKLVRTSLGDMPKYELFADLKDWEPKVGESDIEIVGNLIGVVPGNDFTYSPTTAFSHCNLKIERADKLLRGAITCKGLQGLNASNLERPNNLLDMTATFTCKLDTTKL